jgi:hypothetical protein
LIEACYSEAAGVPEGIDSEDLRMAVAERLDDVHKAEQDAERHLVPEPRVRTFSYAEMHKAAEEAEDGEASSYFRASTRRGDRDSVNVLVLDDPADVELAKHEDWPGRRKARRLYGHLVRLPGWWLKDTEPAEGYLPIVQGSGWLRNTWVIAVVAGAWKGVQQGKSILLTDSTSLGVQRMVQEE